jgi:Abnormal spindle-like microcephaly-assoc'd, ASPM-SPD-2-Hydin
VRKRPPRAGRAGRCVLTCLLFAASVGWIGEGHSSAAAAAELISAQANGTPALTDDYAPSVSGDGNIVVYDSQAFATTVLIETLWVRNRATHTTTQVPQPTSLGPGRTITRMTNGRVSRDGCHVVFFGQWYYDYPAGEWDIWSWNRCVTGSVPVAVATNVLSATDNNGYLAVSADGHYVAYTATRAQTNVPHTARVDTSTLIENVLTTPFVSTLTVDISDDGAFVAIAGTRNIAGANSEQILGWSAPCTTTCTTEVLSVTNSGQTATATSRQPSLSADGRYVAFDSNATEFAGVAPNSPPQVYVRDRVAKVTRLVTDTPGVPLPAGIGVFQPDISPDGSQIALVQESSGETNEVWVARSASGFYDTAVLDLVSFGVSGAGVSGAGAYQPSMSSNGRYVAFSSGSTTELSGGAYPASSVDIWMRERPIALDATPTLSFGNVDVGTQSAPQTAVVTNTSGVEINITGVTQPGAPFTITGNTCGGVLVGGASCAVTVVFSPTVAGASASSITIVGDGLSVSVSLVGIGRPSATAGSLTIAPNAANYGTVSIGSSVAAKTFTVANPGQTPVTFTGVSLSGGGLDQFTITSNTCTGALASGASCTIAVSATVTREGALTASLSVTGTGGQAAQATLRVRGTVVTQVFTPTLKMNPGVVSAGEVTVAIGAGFPPNIAVQLEFEGETPFTTVQTAADGSFRYDFLILRNGVRIGGHQILAVDQPQFSGVRAPLLIDLATFRPSGFSSPAITNGVRSLVSRSG